MNKQRDQIDCERRIYVSNNIDEKDVPFDEQVALLQGLYVFQEDEEVEAFLKRNPLYSAATCEESPEER